MEGWQEESLYPVELSLFSIKRLVAVFTHTVAVTHEIHTVCVSHCSYHSSGMYFKPPPSLPLQLSVHKLQEDVELEWLQQAEVLFCRLERSQSSADPQLKHNPWSLKCHQQHLQRMKENAKHRNQYSILALAENFYLH